jgi:hypothetical protein
VKLTAQSGNGTTDWRGHIIRTEGVVDERSRVIYAVAEVKDPYGVLGETRETPLAVGTFVLGQIDGISGENLTVFPRYALRSDNTVLVADSDKKLQIRNVQIVRATPETVFIQSGLMAGDRIVTTAIEAAIPGTQLAVQGEDEDSADEPGEADDSLLATVETE